MVGLFASCGWMIQKLWAAMMTANGGENRRRIPSYPVLKLAVSGIPMVRFAVSGNDKHSSDEISVSSPRALRYLSLFRLVIASYADLNWPCIIGLDLNPAAIEELQAKWTGATRSLGQRHL